jgi:hypothetical protein
MSHSRPSQRDLAAARQVARQEEMEHAIATGELMVRQMTSEEREQSAPRRAETQARDAATRRPRPPSPPGIGGHGLPDPTSPRRTLVVRAHKRKGPR